MSLELPISPAARDFESSISNGRSAPVFSRMSPQTSLHLLASSCFPTMGIQYRIGEIHRASPGIPNPQLLKVLGTNESNLITRALRPREILPPLYNTKRVANKLKFMRAQLQRQNIVVPDASLGRMHR